MAGTIPTGKMNLRQLGTHSLLNELRQDIQRIVRQQIVLQPEERKVWGETEGKVRAWTILGRSTVCLHETLIRLQLFKQIDVTLS